jgi:outer membrane protein assembly factor BamB
MFLSTPVIVGDRLYGYSDTKRGRFLCLDSRSGEIVWTSAGRQAEHASLIGTPNAVLALKETGELLVFRTGVKELEVLAEYSVADGETWAYPALVDGRLIIVKGTHSLNAWSVPYVD